MEILRRKHYIDGLLLKGKNKRGGPSCRNLCLKEDHLGGPELLDL